MKLTSNCFFLFFPDGDSDADATSERFGCQDSLHMMSTCHPEVTEFLQNYVKPSKDVSDTSGMCASVFNDVIEKHCAKLGMSLPTIYAGDHPLLKVCCISYSKIGLYFSGPVPFMNTLNKLGP